MRLHPHAAGLIAILDPQWRAKIFRGGLVLMIPFVGWPTLLGYRARFVRHLFAPMDSVLPSWNGAFFACFVEGLRALSVIFGYLAPLYATLAWLLHARGWTPDATWWWLCAGFCALPIFSTLSFPTACVLLACSPHPRLSATEALLFFAAFNVLIFVIPAGFLQVSLTGRHASAFALWRTLPFVWRHRRAYVAAWWHSSLFGLVGHFALPIAPWGVAWCYLGIVALFNEILVGAGLAPGEGCLQRALADPLFAPRASFGRRVLRDAAGEGVRVLDCSLFSAPLPGRADPE